MSWRILFSPPARHDTLNAILPRFYFSGEAARKDFSTIGNTRLKSLAIKKPLTSFARYLEVLRWVGLAALVALALTPLIINTGARDDTYFGPKWAWIASWTALGVAAVAARAAAGKVATFQVSEIWIGSFVFALWHWVAALWARSGSLAVERAAQVTWLTLALWLGLQLLNRRRALLWLAWAGVGVGTMTALWVLVEDAMQAWFRSHVWIVSQLGDWRGYLAAGLGNTSHIGDLTALALLPALALLGEARRSRACLLLFVAALLLPAGLIVSFSVGSNFGLIAGAALLAGLVLWRLGARWFTRRKGRWIALALAWAALVAFFVAPHPANPPPRGDLQRGVWLAALEGRRPDAPGDLGRVARNDPPAPARRGRAPAISFTFSPRWTRA